MHLHGAGRHQSHDHYITQRTSRCQRRGCSLWAVTQVLAIACFWLTYQVALDPGSAASSCEVAKVVYGADFGFLTVLLLDDVPGLQIYLDKQWMDVPNHPGTFVVNIADLLER